MAWFVDLGEGCQHMVMCSTAADTSIRWLGPEAV